MRLLRGVEKLFPASTSIFSGPLGMLFEEKILGFLGVHFTSEKCFLFRGAPDMLVYSGGAVIGPSTDVIGSDSEDGAVENCHQRPPLKGFVN